MATRSLQDLDIGEAHRLLNRYLDGDLNGDERSDVARRLEEDAELRAELEGLKTTIGGMKSLPFEFAPDDFVDQVQARMRKQSAGRLFAQNYLSRSRIPYEAIAVVMIAIMAAAYLLLEPPVEVTIEEAASSRSVQD